jgi:hypothetical protein
MQHVLIKIGHLGACLHNTCHKMSNTHPHDVRTDSAEVGSKFFDLLNDYEKLGKLLKQFRVSRNEYIEFFEEVSNKSC